MDRQGREECFVRRSRTCNSPEVSKGSFSSRKKFRMAAGQGQSQSGPCSGKTPVYSLGRR